MYPEINKPMLWNRYLCRALLLLFGLVLVACEATTGSGPGVISDDQLVKDAAAAEANTVDVAGQLSAGIRPGENIVLSDLPVEILFYLSNNTDQPIEILPWATPLERPLTADVFVVTYNGETLPYVGRVVKRAAPSASDYITLQPGEKIESVVNLSQSYDMRSTGEYQITLGQLYLQNSEGEVKSVIADSATKIARQ